MYRKDDESNVTNPKLSSREYNISFIIFLQTLTSDPSLCSICSEEYQFIKPFFINRHDRCMQLIQHLLFTTKSLLFLLVQHFQLFSYTNIDVHGDHKLVSGDRPICVILNSSHFGRSISNIIVENLKKIEKIIRQFSVFKKIFVMTPNFRLWIKKNHTKFIIKIVISGKATYLVTLTTLGPIKLILNKF